jgi:hypothetical protein
MSNISEAPSSAQPTTDTETPETIATTIKTLVDKADKAWKELEQATAKIMALRTSAAEQTKALLEKVGKTECIRLLRAQGIGQTRTYELIAVATGDKTTEEIRDAGAARTRKHRARKKESFSVTGPCNGKPAGANVLPFPPQPPADSGGNPEDTAAEMKAKLAEIDKGIEPKIKPTGDTWSFATERERAAAREAANIEAITRIGRHLLETDRAGARVLFDAIRLDERKLLGALTQVLAPEFSNDDEDDEGGDDDED